MRSHVSCKSHHQTLLDITIKSGIYLHILSRPYVLAVTLNTAASKSCLSAILFHPQNHVNKMAAMDDVQVQEEYDEFRNEDGKFLLIQRFSVVIFLMVVQEFRFSLGLDAVTRLKQSATRKKGRGFDGELRYMINDLAYIVYVHGF